MEKSNDLDLLALEAGIQPGYHDHRGVLRQVADATRISLLQDMGLLEPGEEPEAALARLRRQERQNLLPPVLVRLADEPALAIPLNLHPEEIGRELDYYLALEQGGSFSGRVAGDQLSPGERAEPETGPQRYSLQLHHRLPPGYHRLSLHTAQREASLRLVVAPDRCYLPDRLEQRQDRLWGPTLNLASLRSQANWGVGDFSDLERLIDLVAGLGGDTVGLAPLHLRGPGEEVSPSCRPSTRFFVDPLFLDLTRIADCRADHFRDPEFGALLATCREAGELACGKIAGLKHQGLSMLFADFRRHHLETGSERARAFRMFMAEGGQRLLDHALFFALQDHFGGDEPGRAGWCRWPREFHDPASAAVRDFADRERRLVELHCYILWQCELQAAACGERAMARHLGIGLCPEIAAGVHPEGAEAWSLGPLYSRSATLGTPPEPELPEGRDFRLAPPIPRRLAAAGYEPFAAMLRHNMRHAGAVLLERPTQLLHRFWIPEGGSPADGAYVSYPLPELLGVLALESRRNRCMVMAREHGPAAEGVERQLRERRIFPCAFALQELAQGAGAAELPPATVALGFAPGRPTLAGFWQGLDLEQTGAAEGTAEALARRQGEKEAILAALEEEELLPPATVIEENAAVELSDALNRAIHRFLARRPALVTLVRLEDIFRLREESPRLSPALEEMVASAVLTDFAAAVGRERTAGGAPREVRSSGPLSAVIPRATYRLQLNGGFTFAQAAEIVPYLAELGISHCYTSPCFAARAGSTHGYDVVDPNDFSVEIGGREGFEALQRTLTRHCLGQVIDIVPNHMGVMGSDNAWWLDVLENGRSSAYAQFFDIDWQPVKNELRGKLLVPVLGEPYGFALGQGNLSLVADTASGSFLINYYHHRFPLDPRTYPLILNRRLDMLELRMGPDNPFFIELLSLITAFGQLSPPAEADPKKILIRRRDKEVLKGRLAALAEKCPDIRRHLQETAEEYNSRTAEDANLRDFHILLEEQCFRLAYWRVAADEINYRRFFDINDLASVCVEKREVFDATHRLIFELVRQGKVEGLRVDHPDGLFEPAEYYRRLFHALQEQGQGGQDGESAEAPVYLVVEKILAQHEHLPPEWPVHGTTGYDFVFQVNNLFIDSRAETRMTRVYRRFTRMADDFDTILYHSKKKIMRLVLASELNMLANRLDRLSERSWQTRDFTHNSLREALAEVAACFPVYRTYVTERDLTNQDRNFIDWAIAQAKRNSVVSDRSIFDFIRNVLLPVQAPETDREFRREAVDFAMRFQQFTAPVMAKGMEDTSFYLYNRLVSQNEVGGDPRRFGISVAAFHRLCRDRVERWPSAMLATSTHDSKRSEDARVRLNVLSEVAAEWQRRLLVWRRMNERHARVLDGQVRAPSANDEYLLYQTLLAVWPLAEGGGEGEGGGPVPAALAPRVTAYMEKACREAKVHSSWSEPNPEYEEAVAAFTLALLAEGENPFLDDFLPFQRWIARHGMYNGLSQCLLKLTVPGVPDIYQGCELWNLYLVDPDNRQPVDYARAAALLAGLKHQVAEAGDLRELAAELLATMADGRIKLYLVWRLLAFRRDHEELFRQGSYLPLSADGPLAEHVCGFARRLGKTQVVVVVARFFAGLTDGGQGSPCGPVWAETSLEAPADSPGQWCDLLTGRCLKAEMVEGREVLPLAQVFATLPVACLEYRQ